MIINIIEGMQLRSIVPEIIPSSQKNSGTEIDFSGKISGAPTRGDNSIHFPVNIKSLQTNSLDLEIPVRMSVTHNLAENLSPGMTVSGSGTLQLPPIARNPGGFDYRQFLLGRGKMLVLYPDAHTVEINDESFSIHKIGDLLASRLIDSYENNLDPEVSSWVIALTLGDNTYLTEDQEALIDGAGARHLTAVSGLHINIVAVTLFVILSNRGINFKITSAITVIIVVLYAAAAGFTPSVMRAGLMIMIILLSAIAGKATASLTGWVISLFILLSLSPHLILNPGFQLSFMATLFIILLYPEIRSSNRKLSFYFIEPVKIALCAQLGVLPLLLYHFGWVSLGSLLIAPFVAVILAPLMLTALLFGFLAELPLLGSLLGLTLSIGIKYLVTIISLVSNISPFIWGSWSLIQVLGYYMLIIALFTIKYFPLVFRPVKYLPLIIVISAVMFVSGFILPLQNDLEVYYLDVGQGDATAIFTPGGETILIDGGGVPFDRNMSDTGEYVLLPFFRHMGIKEIDLLIVTHPHTDHFAGLTYLLDYISVDQVLKPDLSADTDEFRLFQDQLIKHQIPVEYVYDPGYFDLQDEVIMEIVHPSSPYLFGTRCDLNNNSIVAKLNWLDIDLLFTGDLEQEGEARVLNYKSEQKIGSLDSHVLKVGHHGSSSASSEPFLAAVSPQAAVISTGENNPYGHPAREVLDRLAKFNVEVFRTDQHGAVKLTSCGETIIIESYLDFEERGIQ